MRQPTRFELRASGVLVLSLFTSWLIAAAHQAYDFDQRCLSHLKAALNTDRIEEARRELDRAVDYLLAHNITSGQVSFLIPGAGGDVGAWYAKLTEAARRLKVASYGGEEMAKTALVAYRTLLVTKPGGPGGEYGQDRLEVPALVFLYPHASLYMLFGMLLALGLGLWVWLASFRNAL